MRTSIIAILVSISAMCFAQDTTTVQLDTITPTAASQKTLQELVAQLQEVAPKYQEAKTVTNQYEDLISRLNMIVEAYIDPKKFAGITQDFKILSK